MTFVYSLIGCIAAGFCIWSAMHNWNNAPIAVIYLAGAILNIIVANKGLTQ